MLFDAFSELHQSLWSPSLAWLVPAFSWSLTLTCQQINMLSTKYNLLGATCGACNPPATGACYPRQGPVTLDRGLLPWIGPVTLDRGQFQLLTDYSFDDYLMLVRCLFDAHLIIIRYLFWCLFDAFSMRFQCSFNACLMLFRCLFDAYLMLFWCFLMSFDAFSELHQSLWSPSIAWLVPACFLISYFDMPAD